MFYVRVVDAFTHDALCFLRFGAFAHFIDQVWPCARRVCQDFDEELNTHAENMAIGHADLKRKREDYAELVNDSNEELSLSAQQLHERSSMVEEDRWMSLRCSTMCCITVL